MKKHYILSSLLSSLLSIFTFLTINAQVSFTADVTSGCGPLTVTFTNTTSDPNADNYQWYFGNGGGWISGTNQTYTYTSSGDFWVYLDAFDNLGNYLGSYNTMVNVLGPPSFFSLNNDSTCINDQTSFYLVGNGDSWLWDFGDGASYLEGSTYGGAWHSYTTPGTYSVSCAVTNTCGTYSLDTIINVVATGVGFSYPPSLYVSADTACPNDVLSFAVDYGLTNVLWDYNDGSFDVSTYSEHSFGNFGWNYIDLTATNGCGSSIVVSDSVFVDSNAPVTFSGMQVPDTICPGQEFNIYVYGNGSANTYQWDMGDGSAVIVDEYVNYTYASVGIYTLNVLITNACGNTLTVPYEIVVSNSAQIQNPYFDLASNLSCPGDFVQFNLSWEYDYYLDFGDGTASTSDWEHVYSNSGVYPVSVTYQNACGNSFTMYDTIYVQDNLPFTGNNIYATVNNNPNCVNSVTDFYAQSGYAGYSWDFGDGGTSTNKDAEHIYNAAGNYDAFVTITNGCGSSTNVYVPVYIVDNLPISTINYNIMGDSVCPGDELLFLTSTNGGLECVWDFGDGFNGVGVVSHSYQNIGTYYVSLTATNGCGNDFTIIDSVVVDNNAFPSANSIQVFAQEQGCVGDELYFVVSPANAGDYTWSFGDGNSTTETFPLLTPEATYDVVLHSYLATGTYEAHFSVTNGCGNSYYDTLFVEVGTIGDPIAAEATFFWNDMEASCQGEPIEFFAVGSSTYSWDFGDGSGVLITSGSLTSVYHTYQNAGSYNIVLTGVNQCGGFDSRTEEIFIPQSLIDITTNAVQLANCGENDGMAVVSATGGMPPYQYGWSNGDNSVIADSLGSGLYVITVTDNNDCSSEGIVTVDDNQGPIILVDGITDIVCYGGSNGNISISILGGSPPYNILWSNGDQTEDIYGLVAGPYEVFVTDANGCMGMESITVTQPEEAIVSIITQPSACGNNTGGAMAVISNGAAPYNYIWPNQTGPVSQTAGLAPGIYELLVIDANTCLLQKEFMINETTAPIILLDSVATGTCSGDLSSIYINTIGGVGPFTYNWSNGTADQDLTDVLPGNYYVQIMGSNGCSSYFTQSVEMTSPAENAICIVSVDTVQGGNLVVWEPVQTIGVDYYNIYKESSQSGLYYLIGTTDADSLSFYHDVYSDPQIRSWRYKISAVDNCGNESDLSDEHKTIHLTANLGVGNVVNLIWDNYEGFNYSTFYVNRYHPTTGWMVIDSLGANLNSYTDVTPPSDSNLVYQVTINAPGLCSAQKAQDHNTTRSNRASINAPEEETETENPDAVEESLAGEIGIMPNPTNGVFTLYFDGHASERSIEIFDLQGKRLANKLCAKENKTIGFDVSKFETGMYLIKIFSDKELKTLRLVKQ
jgi:PKD repeat protein